MDWFFCPLFAPFKQWPLVWKHRNVREFLCQEYVSKWHCQKLSMSNIHLFQLSIWRIPAFGNSMDAGIHCGRGTAVRGRMQTGNWPKVNEVSEKSSVENCLLLTLHYSSEVKITQLLWRQNWNSCFWEVCYWQWKWCFGFTPETSISLFCISIITTTNSPRMWRFYCHDRTVNFPIYGHEKLTDLTIDVRILL